MNYQPLKRDRHARLAALRTGDGRPLPARLATEITRELRRLELVLAMVAEIETERDAIAQGRAADHPHAGKIAGLTAFKGIGAEFATVLVGEVFYRCFANRRQLGSYLGLAGSAFDSGRTRREQGISKAGNPKARTTAIELAWMWLRHQPDSALSVWFRQRVGALKGRIRRIAIPGSSPRTALARKLIVALWRYLEAGLVPDGAVLKA